MRRNLLLIVLLVSLAVSAQAEEKSLNGQQFTLAPGFGLELVATAPLVERPIAADFDEEGHLYVTESSGSNDKVEVQLREQPHRVLRLEDTDGDGKFDRRTVFADKLMLPQGVLWHDGSLYVAAPPSIWKFTDTNHDGIADERVEWFAGRTLTGCANDLHGPYLGRDGWIYWCKGAFAEQTYERPGRAPLVTRAAHIFRARPDGSGIEAVMTGGMDNPVDVAFTATGERIFTTTFLQHPGGGKRDGLIHAIYGGVYGKEHGVLDGHPRTGELMPVLSHLGAAAPAGLTTYESKQFGEGYAGNLFAALFNMHKVTRHVLSENGAGLKSLDEDFLVSDQLDFHPTDVLEDADGSLLVVDTGGWYKLCCPTSQLSKPDVLGAIYRVRKLDAKPLEDPRGLKLAWHDLSTEALLDRLADPRPAVRQRATKLLVQQGERALSALQKRHASASQAEVRQRLLWTAMQIPGTTAQAFVRAGLQDQDAPVRQVALQGVSLQRDAEALPRLMELLDAKYPANHRRLAAEALGRIGDRAAIAAILQASAQLDHLDRALEHAFAYALIEVNDAEATSKGLASKALSTQRIALLALSEMPAGKLTAAQVTPLLDAKEPALRETATWVVSRHADWGNDLASYFAAQIKKKELSDEQRAALRQQLSQFAAASAVTKLLADLASDPANTMAQRQLALQAMAQARLKEIPTVWQDSIRKVIEGDERPLVADGVATIARLPRTKALTPELSAALLQVAGDNKQTTALRMQSLAAQAHQDQKLPADLVALLIGQLSTEADVATRAASIATLTKVKLDAQQLQMVAGALATVGPLEVNPLLTLFEDSSERAVGQKLVETLRSSPAIAAVRADALQRALAKFSPEVQQAAQPLFEQLALDGEKQRAALDTLLTTLPTGDARRGLAVFHSRKAACFSCHALGYLGGNVGPDLTHVGRIRSKQDLLEAVVFPSASFVRSYEPVVVVMQDGTTHSGNVRSESADELELATGPDKLVRLPRSEVEEINPGRVSLMPAGLDKQLTAQELADLVAFLQSAK